MSNVFTTQTLFYSPTMKYRRVHVNL